ncbi:MAG: ferritin [Chlamydiae bacterium SM23_39]|nr:MAG: ferritin [Chlamydiae bacterium SM23_39]
MGTKAKEIVSLKVDELLRLLNKALSDEWLAYYQYWIGSKIVVGMMSNHVSLEFKEHAEEELKHAGMIVKRILELKGVPILEPKKWYEESNCEYLIPENFDVKSLLKQNIEGERCAIDVYKKLLDFTRGKDEITFQMVLEILKDEITHEDELQKILEEDLHVLK